MDNVFRNQIPPQSLPYLSSIEREAFNRSDKASMYRTASLQVNGSPDYFIIHVPFTKDEHDRVIEYLSIIRFVDFDIPYHHLPFQLQNVLKNRSMKAILNYIGELIVKKSCSYDLNEKEIRLYSPTKQNVDFVDVSFPLSNLFGQIKGPIRIVYHKHIINRTFVILVEDSLPVVYTMRKNEMELMKLYCQDVPIEKQKICCQDLPIEEQKYCFVCPSNAKWGCLYYDQQLIFWNFTKKFEISIRGNKIDSYKSKRKTIEFMDLKKMVASESKKYTLAAIFRDNVSVFKKGVYIHQLLSETANDIVFTKDHELIVVTENNSILVYDDSDFSLKYENVAFTGFVLIPNSKGDAFVFQDNTDHIYVYTYQNKVYDISFNSKIKQAAFCGGSLSCLTVDRTVFIANLDQQKSMVCCPKITIDQRIKENESLWPIGNSVFCFCSQSKLVIFNSSGYSNEHKFNGHKIISEYIDNNGKFGVFVHSNDIVLYEFNIKMK